MQFKKSHAPIICIISISLIILWGSFLRVHTIQQPSYWIDEGYSITIAQAIQRTGFPLLDSGSLEWRSPVFHYALAGVTSLFGTTEVSVRIISVLSGIGVMVLLTYIAYAWFGKTTAILTAAITSFAYFQIAWSRQARMYMVFEFFFWLSIFLFDRFLYTKNRRRTYAIACILSTICALLSHEIGALLIIPYALSLIFYVYRSYPKRAPVQLIVLYVASICIIILVGILAIQNVLHLPSPVQYASHYASFVFTHYADLLALALLSWWYIRKTTDHERSVYFVLLGTFLGMYAFFSFAFPLLQYRYLLVATPALFFFAATGLRACLRIPYVGGLLVAAVFAFSPTLTYIPRVDWPLESDPPTNRFTYNSFTPQPDFKAAYAFIRAHPREQLITPYPMLTRIYLGYDDTSSIYFDLTGGLHDRTTIQDPYTGVLTLQLPALQQHIRTQHGYILLDQFAAYHMDQELREYIEEQTKPVYTSITGPWSELTIFAY